MPATSGGPAGRAPTVLSTDSHAATAWEQGAVIEDWAAFYFPARTAYEELKACAEAVVPQSAWQEHVAAAEARGEKPQKPDEVNDFMQRRLLQLGRRLHRLNCFVVSRVTPSLDVEIEEVHFRDSGRRNKTFAVGPTGLETPPDADDTHASAASRRVSAGDHTGEPHAAAPSSRSHSVEQQLKSRRRDRESEALATQAASLHLLLQDSGSDGADDAEYEPTEEGSPMRSCGSPRAANCGGKTLSLFQMNQNSPPPPEVSVLPPPSLEPAVNHNGDNGDSNGGHVHWNGLPPFGSSSPGGQDDHDPHEFHFTLGTRAGSIDVATPNPSPKARGRRMSMFGGSGNQIELRTPDQPNLAESFSFGAAPNTGLSASFAAMPQEDQEQQLLEAVHAVMVFNEDLSAALKKGAGVVIEFYQRTTAVVSGCAAACIDRLKALEGMPKKRRAQLEKTIHQTAYSLSMLQEFCDHNFVAINAFIGDVGKVSFQRIEVGASLMLQPFFMTRQRSSIAQLRELLVKSYADMMLEGDLREAHARIARFADPDDGLQGTKSSWLRLDRASEAAVAGFVLGVIVFMSLVVLFLFVGEQFWLRYIDQADHAAYLFSVTGVPILFAFLFTLNVAVWERYKVNFAFSFRLHPFRHFTSTSVLIHNGAMAIVWLVCAFFFLRAAGLEFADIEARRALDVLDSCTGTLDEAWQNATDAGCGGSLVAGRNDTVFRSSARVARFLTGSLRRSTDAPLVPAYLWPYLVFPLGFIVFILGRLVKRARKEPPFLLPSLLRIIVTPYFSVTFTDFFVCEQLVSLADVLFEWQWLWCAFSDTDSSTGHHCREARSFYICAIAMLPALWRMLQSLRRFRDNPDQRSFYPHMLNATKYFISLVRMGIQVWAAVEFRGEALAKNKIQADGDTVHVDYDPDAVTAALVCFVIAYFVETCVKMGYEIWVEYGVMRCNARHCLLRDTILFPPMLYYPCMVANFVIRWMWVLKLLIAKVWFDTDPEWVFPVFAVLEILRRIMWNWFRVEYDQVDNTEHYKAVQIAPLQSIRHASSNVDWQLTEEDVDRQFNASSTSDPAASPDAFLHPPAAASGPLASDDEAEAPRRGRSRLKRRVLATKVSAFFNELPMSERIAVLRTVLPEHEFQEVDEGGASLRRSGRRGSSSPKPDRFKVFFRVRRGPVEKVLPPTRLFNSLHEEDKVRALLMRIGPDRTIAQYHDEVSAMKHRASTPTGGGRHAPAPRIERTLTDVVDDEGRAVRRPSGLGRRASQMRSTQASGLQTPANSGDDEPVHRRKSSPSLAGTSAEPHAAEPF